MSLRIAYGVAVVLALLAVDEGVRGARAELAPDVTLISIGHEVCGERFTYQVEEHDTSDSIASHFGEPALTLFPDGNEPKPGDTTTIDNRHPAPAALAEGIVINVPQRMLFVFQDGHLAGRGRSRWDAPIGAHRSAAIGSLRLN
jgi:hypothetical protein